MHSYVSISSVTFKKELIYQDDSLYFSDHKMFGQNISIFKFDRCPRSKEIYLSLPNKI